MNCVPLAHHLINIPVAWGLYPALKKKRFSKREQSIRRAGYGCRQLFASLTELPSGPSGRTEKIQYILLPLLREFFRRLRWDRRRFRRDTVSFANAQHAMITLMLNGGAKGRMSCRLAVHWTGYSRSDCVQETCSAETATPFQ